MPLTFEQQPKESDKAFAAFSLYLSMGPQRSTQAVASKLAKSEQLIRRWSARHAWASRVQSYGAHLAVVEREATEAAVRAKSAEWLKRQEEHKEDEWLLRGELVEAGRKVLLKFRDGTKGATLGDVARALELASKLGRMASGLATETIEHTGPDGGPIQIEFQAALDKIYGQAEPAPHASTVVDVEAEPVKAIEEGSHDGN